MNVGRITLLKRPRRIGVSKVDFGNGEREDAWLIVSQTGIAIKRRQAREPGFFLSIEALARLVAVKAQVSEANKVLKKRRRVRSSKHGPLFDGVTDGSRQQRKKGRAARDRRSEPGRRAGGGGEEST